MSKEFDYKKASCMFDELENMHVEGKLSEKLSEFLKKMNLWIEEDDIPYLSYDEWEKTPNSIFLIIQNMKGNIHDRR